MISKLGPEADGGPAYMVGDPLFAARVPVEVRDYVLKLPEHVTDVFVDVRFRGYSGSRVSGPSLPFLTHNRPRAASFKVEHLVA